jgi:hypothetical protein
MVSMEAVQAMLQQLTEHNNQNMAALAQQQMEALQAIVQGSQRQESGLTDNRGIGRPIVFKGDEARYAEWKAKLMAYLRVTVPSSDAWLTWAGEQGRAITEEDIDEHFPQQAAKVKEFAIRLYAILMSCTEEDAFRICHSVKDGNGLEAVRLVFKRYEPRTPGTKRAVLKALINNQAAKKPEDIEKNLMHVEELMKKYEVLTGVALPEDLRVTVIVDLCTKDLRENLEYNTRDMTYKEVRDEIMSYVERKRDTFGSQLKAMEVDNYEKGWYGSGEEEWWPEEGAGENEEYMKWEESPSGEVYQVQTQWGKGGKGAKGGKGGKGYQQWNKGGKKGGGKGYQQYSQQYPQKGKGSSSSSTEFQGHCHWCGEWGHPQTRCKQKDEYMEEARKSGSGGGKWQDRSGQTNVVEQEKPNNNSNNTLESLEKNEEGSWRTLCYLEEKQEVNAVEEKLWITIDSGASENVIAENMVPNVEVKPSQGSKEGVQYITANGGVMPNRGEKEVKVITGEGHKCMLKMQVTDVKKPLMSVARICDAGHNVVFTKGGGYIEHVTTGQRTKFVRIDNVYRLKVGVQDEEVDFSRQGN